MLVIVSHDSYLSRVSDVEKFRNFKDRRKVRTLDGEEKHDWWISDFTVKELKKLTIK